jgi:hypothetical protein
VSIFIGLDCDELMENSMATYYGVDSGLADVAAQEILEGYRALNGQHWVGDKPIPHEFHVSSLEGVPYSPELTAAVSYGETVKLRKGHGIIAAIFCHASVCTGEVRVQPACDDFDL